MDADVIPAVAAEITQAVAAEITQAVAAEKLLSGANAADINVRKIF